MKSARPKSFLVNITTTSVYLDPIVCLSFGTPRTSACTHKPSTKCPIAIVAPPAGTSFTINAHAARARGVNARLRLYKSDAYGWCAYAYVTTSRIWQAEQAPMTWGILWPLRVYIRFALRAESLSFCVRRAFSSHDVEHMWHHSNEYVNVIKQGIRRTECVWRCVCVWNDAGYI